MALGDRLKAFTARARSKSSNLNQNEDLMDELGYSKPQATPAPAPQKAGFMGALSKALAARKKKPTAAVGATRG